MCPKKVYGPKTICSAWVASKFLKGWLVETALQTCIRQEWNKYHSNFTKPCEVSVISIWELRHVVLNSKNWTLWGGITLNQKCGKPLWESAVPWNVRVLFGSADRFSSLSLKAENVVKSDPITLASYASSKNDLKSSWLRRVAHSDTKIKFLYWTWGTENNTCTVWCKQPYDEALNKWRVLSIRSQKREASHTRFGSIAILEMKFSSQFNQQISVRLQSSHNATNNKHTTSIVTYIANKAHSPK